MKTTTGRTENSVEALESRIAPAGVVNVTISGGVLTIEGDNEGNRLEIEAIPNGQLLVSTDDDTDLGAGPGVSRILTGPVKSIVSDMSGGEDSLLIFGVKTLASVKFTGGAGNDLIILGNVAVSGGVQADLGEGDDQFGLIGSNVQVGNLTVQGGNGDNTYFFNTLKAIVRGTLAISGGSGSDSLEIHTPDLQLLRNATVTLGEGENHTLFDSHANIQVRGSLSITGGNGGNRVDLGVGAALSVRGNLAFGFGNGQNVVFQDEFGSISVGGTFRATGGSDVDNFSFGGVSFTARDVVFDPGDGSNFVRLNTFAATLRNLTISGGADGDDIQIQNSNLTITGRVQVNGGDGSDHIGLEAGNLVARSASFLGGNGTDNVHVAGEGRFSGPVLVDTGTGGSEVDPQGILVEGGASGLVFSSSFTVRSTGGADSRDEFRMTTAEIRGKADIRMGDGTSIVNLDDVYLKNSLQLDTNGGNDSIGFEVSFFPFESQALKTVTILPGAGDDEVRIGAGNERLRVDFRGKLSVIDESGNDTINDVEDSNLFRPGIRPVITGFENRVSMLGA